MQLACPSGRRATCDLDMLYYLSLLRVEFFGFNVFSYITFRSGAASVTAFLISLLFGSRIIEKLIAAGMVNKPKVWGPKSHELKTGIADKITGVHEIVKKTG